MRQPVLTLRGYIGVLLVDIAARRAGRTSALALGALLSVSLVLAGAIGLRTTGEAGPVRDVALSAPAAGGAAASAAQVRSVQAETGLREYLPGEVAGASGSRTGGLGGLLEYLPGEGTTLAVSGAAASAAGVRPAHTETGLREYLPGEVAGASVSRTGTLGGLLEYLPGEGTTLATAARSGAGPLEYLPGEVSAGAGGTGIPLVGPQP